MKMNDRRVDYCTMVLKCSLVVLFVSLFAGMVFAGNIEVKASYVSSVSDTGVTMEVITKDSSYVNVQYALDKNGFKSKSTRTLVNSPTVGKQHVIPISGLLPGTRYYYRIVGTVTNGGYTELVDNNGDYFSFTTTGVGSGSTSGGSSSSGVVVNSDSDVSDLREDSKDGKTVLSFKTVYSSTTNVSYGVGSLSKMVVVSKSPSMSHSVTIDTENDKVYSYSVRSCSSNGCFTTSEKAFHSFSSGPAGLIVTIPNGTNVNTIMANGSTRAGLLLNIYVNGELRNAKMSTPDGSFVFGNVRLRDGLNTISFEVLDGAIKIKKEYVVVYDSVPPALNISWSPDTSVTKESKVRVNGSTSEIVVITINGEVQLDGSKFDKTLNLLPGENNVSVSLVDKGGNVYEDKRIITYDNVPLTLTSNLARLKTAYNQEIKITGKTNKKALVSAKVNGKVEKSATTNDAGEFSMNVPLTGKTSTKVEGSTLSSSLNKGLVNSIELFAADAAGYTASDGPAQVTRLLCGGGQILVKKSNIIPQTLIPRLMMKGIQKVSQTLEFEPINKNIKISSVRAYQPQFLSDDVKKEYDFGWFSVASKPKLRLPDKRAAAIMLNLNAIDPASLKGSTTSEKERDLSVHRQGECDDDIAGGCFKALVFIDIEYQEVVDVSPDDPTLANQLPQRIASESKIQTECLEYEVKIDQQIDPDIISDKFLKRAVTNLDHAIEDLEKVEEKTRQAVEATYYGCFASTLADAGLGIAEAWTCKYSGGAKGAINEIRAKLGDKKVVSIRDIANIGKCDELPDKEKSSCNACKSILEKRKSTADFRRSVCNRVQCPSVPTFQTYIRAQQAKPLKVVSVPQETGPTPKLYYAGSSCSFKNTKTSTPGALGIDGATAITQSDFNLVGSDYDQVSKLYANTKDDNLINSVSPSSVSGVNSPKCNDPSHPADPRCCAFEYQQRYKSGCGWFVNAPFDELKESVCLGAQNAGKFEDTNDKTLEGVSCRGSYGKSGLCDSNAGLLKATPDLYAPNVNNFKWTVTFAEAQGGAVSTREVLVQTKPIGANDGLNIGSILGDERVDKYEVTLGMRKIGYSGVLSNGETKIGSDDVYSTIGAAADDGVFGSDRTASLTEIKSWLNTFDGKIEGGKEDYADEIYDHVRQVIGNKDTTYIVRPDDGLINSLQCGCFSGVYSNVNTVRKTLSLVRDCLRSIEVTGDADPGVCKEVITETACNLFWEGLRCLAPTITSPGKGGADSTDNDETDTVGGLFKSVSEGFSSARRTAIEEGGNDPVFEALFSEKQMQNAACMYAFTGQWDFDLGGIIDAKLDERPSKTIGFLPIVRREFISYDPTTKPKGLTTWAYRTAPLLTAGTDITVQLDLVCSDSIQCDASQGYLGGKCDCYGLGEKKIGVPLSKSSLRKGEQLGASASDEIIHTVMAGESGSNYRYDKAVLRWQWVDKKTGEARSDKVERGIITGSTQAPIQCQFDLFAGVFRCDTGIDNYAGARFSGDPTPAGNAVQGVFTLDNKIDFKIPIFVQKDKMQEDSSERTKDTKWLVYKIYDHNRNLIYDNTKSPILVNHEGSKEMVISQDGGDPMTLGQVNFNAHSQRTIVKFAKDDDGRNTDPNFRIDDSNVRPGTEQFIIKITKEGTQLKKAIYKVGPGDAKPQPDAVSGSGDSYSIGTQLEPNTGTVNFDNTINYKGILITFSQSMFSDLSVKKAEYIHVIPRTVSVDACKKYENTPASWNVVFTLYDSISTNTGGGYVPNYHQKTLDPVSEQEQEKTIPFQVVCSKTYAGATAGNTPKICALGQNTAGPCYCGNEQKPTKENCGRGNIDATNSGKELCGYKKPVPPASTPPVPREKVCVATERDADFTEPAIATQTAQATTTTTTVTETATTTSSTKSIALKYAASERYYYVYVAGTRTKLYMARRDNGINGLFLLLDIPDDADQRYGTFKIMNGVATVSDLSTFEKPKAEFVKVIGATSNNPKYDALLKAIKKFGEQDTTVTTDIVEEYT